MEMKRSRSLGVLLIAMLFILGAVLFAPRAEAANKSVTFKLTTLDGKSITEKTYGSRYQILVFYRSLLSDGEAVCWNSASFLQSLAPALEQGWIQDLDVQIIMVGGDGNSTTSELKSFVKKYASGVSSKNVVFTRVNEDLMWKIHGSGYLTYSYCVLVKDGKVLEETDAVYDAVSLLGLLEGHADTGKLYQTIQVTAKHDYASAFEVLEKTNAERKAEGLAALKMDKDLMTAAMQRAAEISTYFSHTRPNAKICASIHKKVNGENIAAGQADSETVMTDWMNSPGHRANILTEEFVTMGVGAVQINGTMFWVQLFGCSSDSSAVAKKADYTTDKLVTKYPKIQFAAAYLKNGTIYQVVQPEDTVFEVGGKKTIKIVYSEDPAADWFYATPLTSKLTFASSNTAVATVSDKGVITAVKSGDATITVRSKLSADSAPALLELKISVEVKPAVSTQPKNKTVAVGDKATLTVKATGGGLSYQWYYRTSASGSWKKVTAAAGKKASYVLTAAAKHDGYQYRCLIKNTKGSLYSKAVTLRVKPAITTQPVKKSVAAGKTVKFTVTAVGKDVKYQWYYRKNSSSSWTAISAASGKTAAYSLTAKAKHNGYQYRCKVYNGAGYVYSKTVTLTVK